MSDDQPHSRTIWALGVAFSFIINGLIDIPLAYFFGCYLSTVQKVIIAVLLLLLFYLKYYKNGRGKRIVEIEKPKFFNSHRASMILTILFFLISMLFLFFKAEIMIKILEIDEL